MNLRKLARGKPCMVLLEGCDGGGETTVLAHIRKAHIAGMGQKPPDLCGVYACHNCHGLIDARQKTVLDAASMNTVILYALLRTLAHVQAHIDEQ
jgi:hypothetical protein